MSLPLGEDRATGANVLAAHLGRIQQDIVMKADQILRVPTK